mmetsp:Transcript_14473/g.45270  ORF Transcript_14473/g.45270 Transcript_14473/m.45270 type:complete len:323 (-) Transcript_14473:243-1211(-)
MKCLTITPPPEAAACASKRAKPDEARKWGPRAGRARQKNVAVAVQFATRDACSRVPRAVVAVRLLAVWHVEVNRSHRLKRRPACLLHDLGHLARVDELVAEARGEHQRRGRAPDAAPRCAAHVQQVERLHLQAHRLGVVLYQHVCKIVVAVVEGGIAAALARVERAGRHVHALHHGRGLAHVLAHVCCQRRRQRVVRGDGLAEAKELLAAVCIVGEGVWVAVARGGALARYNDGAHRRGRLQPPAGAHPYDDHLSVHHRARLAHDHVHVGHAHERGDDRDRLPAVSACVRHEPAAGDHLVHAAVECRLEHGRQELSAAHVAH